VEEKITRKDYFDLRTRYETQLNVGDNLRKLLQDQKKVFEKVSVALLLSIGYSLGITLGLIAVIIIQVIK